MVEHSKEHKFFTLRELIMFVSGGLLPLLATGLYLGGGGQNVPQPTFNGLIALLQGLGIFYIGLLVMWAFVSFAKIERKEE